MGRKSERLLVVDELKTYVDFLGMSLDAISAEVARLREAVAKEGGVVDSAYVDYDYYGDYNGFETRIKYRRLETDVEYEKRLETDRKERERIKTKKAKKEAEARALYEKLKAKFGD